MEQEKTLEETVAAKSSVETIATDIYNMIASAKADGLDMQGGFHNQPLSTPTLALRYLFFPKAELVAVPGIPENVVMALKESNVLAAVEVNGQMAGIHLVCALDKPFAEVENEQEVMDAVDGQAILAYEAQVKEVMRSEFEAAKEKAGYTPDTTQ